MTEAAQALIKLAERAVVALEGIEWHLRAMSGEAEETVVAYGAPPVDNALQERSQIATWLRGHGAVSLTGRRTVSTISVEEMLGVLARAIEKGDHKGGNS